MWATATELNLKDPDCNQYIEKNGMLLFTKEGLTNIQSKIDIADTQFLQVGNKIHDISGYTTGVGLGVKEVFKMIKKKNAFRFNSDFNILTDCECLNTISDDILEIYPHDILNKLDSKLFFCLEERSCDTEARKPSRFENKKHTNINSIRIYFIKNH